MGLVRRGSREQLIADLENVAGGCLGSDAYREQAREAAEAIRNGADSAEAGHIIYQVAGDDAGNAGPSPSGYEVSR